MELIIVIAIVIATFTITGRLWRIAEATERTAAASERAADAAERSAAASEQLVGLAQAKPTSVD
ncbi:hypothetical protein [Agromyces sp. NPDC058064]|uniref:hypothetical protein n=1 Tax=Agromyces sp. NPDC058064 TaxID=3346322 RepID=UPI0036DB1462